MENADKNLAKIYHSLGDLKKDFRNSNLIDLVCSFVTGHRVLEIGCGNGHLLSQLQKSGKDVFGIEPNNELIDLAKRNNPSLQIVKGNLENAKSLTNGDFNSIVMTDVLEHIENDSEAVKQVGDLLANDGQFLVVVPAYQFLYCQRDKKIGHFRRYNKKTLRHVLEKNGFVISKMRYWNMLGVLPYFISEKILHMSIDSTFRRQTETKNWKKVISSLLYFWFAIVENDFNFGFGLSLICVAEKTKN